MATDPLKLSTCLYPINHNVSMFPRQSSFYNPKYNNKRINCSIKAQNPHSASERRSANYQPTTWSYNFLQSLKSDYADELYKDRARMLEEEVRSMIKNESEEMLKKLELIDDIQKLGLGFLFQEEIKNSMESFAGLLGGLSLTNSIPSTSLHAISLLFRLLRQHGFHVSQDVFKDFMDHEGEIQACFKEDVKGMLSLYEASHLGMEGEELLEKARARTTTHLNDLKRNSKLEILESVSHAIELPLCRRMVMLEARWYIDAYSKRKDANHFLLELAQINFNMVQSVLQADLKDMSRWWKNLGIANTLNFSRDRLMECFFWTVGMMFEPQFSSCRKVLTKVTSFITTIDDVYDVYGTLDELELFTQAVERWDVNAVKDMPDYMKVSFLSLYNTINEIAYDTLKQQGEYVLPYLIKAWADICKSFLQEAKWSHNKCIPSFDEYIENGWVSVSGCLLLTHAYFMVDENYSKQAIDSLVNYHEILRWASIIFRLYNDLATSSDEINRGEVANSISCYMHDNGVSEEEARRNINELIDKAWKKLNEYKIGGSPFAKTFVETAFNLARIAQCTYERGDSHGSPDSISKKRVLSLIIESISLPHTQVRAQTFSN